MQAFPDELSGPGHDSFFSAETASSWIASLGYQLYTLQLDSVTPTNLWTPDDASTRKLIAYHPCMCF
jgi:hypothetical protein